MPIQSNWFKRGESGFVHPEGGINYYNYKGPWKAYGANPTDPPFPIPTYYSPPGHPGHYYSATILRSPPRGAGLKIVEDIASSSRIKSFRLKDGLVYSYAYDLRFVTLISLLLGFTAWWSLSPDIVLYNVKILSVLKSNFHLGVEFLQDSLTKRLCTIHDVPSPCPCVEPLHKVMGRTLGGSTFWSFKY